MSRFLLPSAQRERLAAAVRLPKRILAPAFAGASAAFSGPAVTDRPVGAPSGSAPSGSAPSGSAPSGSAHSGGAPTTVAPTAIPPSAAVADTAHRGDIRGAFGTVHAGAHDESASWAGGCAACWRSWAPA